MLIRIIAKNPGCAFEIGQLIRVGDKQGVIAIAAGYGEQVAEEAVAKPPSRTSTYTPTRTPAASPHMLPPRFICACGFVAKDEKGLAEHRKVC